MFPAAVVVPRPPSAGIAQLRSVSFLSGQLSFPPNPLLLSYRGGRSDGAIRLPSRSSPSPFVIRMGGGPRTFPGGVSKWQWKRMQDKKAKQLLKARLLRERQLYEMRKRTELKAAVAQLERPWEEVDRIVEAAPTLFSVAADEQVKALADRFHRAGGFDMWTDRDGPQVFRSPPRQGLQPPTARFFPEGALHSLKPYGVVGGEKDEDELRSGKWTRKRGRGTRRTPMRALKPAESSEFAEAIDVEAKNLDSDGSMLGRESISLSNNLKSSKISRKFSKQDNNAMPNRKDSLEEGFIQNSINKRHTRFTDSTNRSRYHDNQRNSVSMNGLSSSKYTNPITDSREVGRNRNRLGFQSRFNSTIENEMASGKIDTEKKVANRRTNIDESISLRPTTPLYYNKGRYRKENSEHSLKNMSGYQDD